MKPPLFVRLLSENERKTLQTGLRSKDAFVMRRSQILLANSRGLSPANIARSLGCASQTLTNSIQACNDRGLLALTPGSSPPKHVHAAFDEQSAESLREMLYRSVREFGYDSSLWTLEMAAEVSFEEGPTQRCVSGETVRATLVRHLGVRWLRAKRWITSPDLLYERRRERLMGVAEADPDASWAVGICDECWCSRLAVPTLRAAGARRASPCASFNGRSPKTSPSRRPSPASDSTFQRSARCGCASLMAGSSVP